MKNIILGFILSIFLLASCKKDSITPGNYKTTPAPIDTNHWQNQYTNGGVLPTNTSNSGANEVVGTTWVLTYLQIGFSTSPLPIDTIRFITNNQYSINSGAVRPYNLSTSAGVSSKSLTLNYHYPFGSGNYSGQVASTFVADGVILNCEFVNTNTSTTKVRASFKKI